MRTYALYDRNAVMFVTMSVCAVKAVLSLLWLLGNVQLQVLYLKAAGLDKMYLDWKEFGIYA